MTHCAESETPCHPHPPWLQERLEWFMDLRFGLFIHWGPYAQWDCCESWPLVPADTWARPDHLRCWIERDRNLEWFSRDYRALNRTFNPIRFDPDAWAECARSTGMRYITFTTKHHDGFCMFDTATTDYRVTYPDCPFHMNPRANVTREVFDAFRRKGMAISCYFSKSDWHCPYYWSPDVPPMDRNPNYNTRERPERWAQFVDFVHRQVEELMTGYGPIDVLWLDGGQVRPPEQDIQMDKLVAMARVHQPGLIIADRTVGGPYENFISPEQQIPDEPLDIPWESCITLGHSWKFIPDDAYKPARRVIHMLIEVASKGGNLLLGVGPTPEGTLPQQACERLREVGTWMRVNGEAIYGTRPVLPHQQGGVPLTEKAPYVYAFILPAEGEHAPPPRIILEQLQPKPGSSIELLGTPESLTWQADARGVTVHLPRIPLACDHAWVVRLVPAKG